ncbi:hypothetical protein Scep_002131 [Stephania cephalantha]|uniref:Uncharacterized protein n=1 Tax=Stephania cephalantha TaxID=152367 RepID=A0AAP0LAF5_9MAGN
MMKHLIDDQQRFHEELKQSSCEFPSLQNLDTQLIQLNATLQNMADEKELCNTQPISYPEKNASVDKLRNVEVNEVTHVEDYWNKIVEELAVFKIEPEIVIAQDEEQENEIKIKVISEMPEEPQKESKEDLPLYTINFIPEEDMSVDTLKNFEVNEVTHMEDYLRETSEEREAFQIEPEIVIALNEVENEIKIDVISDKSEKPQIESGEDQPLVLVQPPTLPCTFGTPYKGVEVKECSQIFYTADTLVLDDPDATYSFMLELQNELLNLKEGVHASFPKYVDATFVVDISKEEGIT